MRRSCQTSARWIGSPVAGSQATTVSRWLVIPIAVELGPLDAGVDDRLDRDAPGHVPDLGGVVLDPARPREVLLELRVGAAGDPPLRVEDEAGGARRPLVDRQDHGSPRRTRQLRFRVELKRRPSSKTIEARAKGKTAAGEAGGSQRRRR